MNFKQNQISKFPTDNIFLIIASKSIYYRRKAEGQIRTQVKTSKQAVQDTKNKNTTPPLNPLHQIKKPKTKSFNFSPMYVSLVSTFLPWNFLEQAMS